MSALGAFENRRSFTSIGNLCVVIDGFLTKNVSSGIYHMGDDEALSTNELIQVICEALGKKTHIWCIPKGLMNGVAKVGGIGFIFRLTLFGCRNSQKIM